LALFADLLKNAKVRSVYTESKTKESAEALAKRMMDDMRVMFDVSGNE